MTKRFLLVAALAAMLSAAFFVYRDRHSATVIGTRGNFVDARGARFVIGGRPFRFVGANVAVIYGNDERTLMADTLRQAARLGMGVVRIWAYGESGEDDGTTAGVAQNHWLRVNPFRRGPEEWNEAAFVSLDRALAKQRVTTCASNSVSPTGGVIRVESSATCVGRVCQTQPTTRNPMASMLPERCCSIQARDAPNVSRPSGETCPAPQHRLGGIVPRRSDDLWLGVDE